MGIKRLARSHPNYLSFGCSGVGSCAPPQGTYKLSASIGNQPDSRKVRHRLLALPCAASYVQIAQTGRFRRHVQVTSLGCSFGKAGLGNSPEKPNVRQLRDAGHSTHSTVHSIPCKPHRRRKSGVCWST
jgi:hypothetical protein